MAAILDLPAERVEEVRHLGELLDPGALVPAAEEHDALGFVAQLVEEHR